MSTGNMENTVLFAVIDTTNSNGAFQRSMEAVYQNSAPQIVNIAFEAGKPINAALLNNVKTIMFVVDLSQEINLEAIEVLRRQINRLKEKPQIILVATNADNRNEQTFSELTRYAYEEKLSYRHYPFEKERSIQAVLDSVIYDRKLFDAGDELEHEDVKRSLEILGDFLNLHYDDKLFKLASTNEIFLKGIRFQHELEGHLKCLVWLEKAGIINQDELKQKISSALQAIIAGSVNYISQRLSKLQSQVKETQVKANVVLNSPYKESYQGRFNQDTAAPVKALALIKAIQRKDLQSLITAKPESAIAALSLLVEDLEAQMSSLQEAGEYLQDNIDRKTVFIRPKVTLKGDRTTHFPKGKVSDEFRGEHPELFGMQNVTTSGKRKGTLKEEEVAYLQDKFTTQFSGPSDVPLTEEELMHLGVALTKQQIADIVALSVRLADKYHDAQRTKIINELMALSKPMGK